MQQCLRSLSIDGTDKQVIEKKSKKNLVSSEKGCTFAPAFRVRKAYSEFKIHNSELIIVLWCNGSTSDSGSACLGSNPGRTTESADKYQRFMFVYTPNTFKSKLLIYFIFYNLKTIIQIHLMGINVDISCVFV